MGPTAVPAEAVAPQMPTDEAALARIVEDVADQGEGGGHQGGARDTEQRPGEDHQLRCRRVGVEHGDRAERRGAAEQDPLAADAVAEAAMETSRPAMTNE